MKKTMVMAIYSYMAGHEEVLRQLVSVLEVFSTSFPLNYKRFQAHTRLQFALSLFNRHLEAGNNLRRRSIEELSPPVKRPLQINTDWAEMPTQSTCATSIRRFRIYPTSTLHVTGIHRRPVRVGQAIPCGTHVVLLCPLA